MSDIRWIKVTVDMFEDNKIEFIRSLPDGDAIIVTWIQMLSIAGQSNMGGYLMVSEDIPYSEQLLSNKLRRQPVFLQFALETLTRLKMIDIEDGPFHITKWEKHQNVEGMEKVRIQTNDRVKKHRLKEKEKLETLQGNATVTLPVTRGNATELDIEKEFTTTTTAHEFETVEQVHLHVFGKIIFPPIMSAFIMKIKNKGHTDAFVKEVLLEAGESSSGTPNMRYLETIFESWDREGIYTRIEAKARRDNAKQKPQRQPVHFNHAMQLQKENEGRNEQPMDGFFDAG
jgi:predicted phage replisome organizer